MATITVKPDKRYRNAKGESPIVFFIEKKKSKATISNGLFATEDIVTNDGAKMFKDSVPNAKNTNAEIYTQLLTYNSALQELVRTGKEERMTAMEIKTTNSTFSQVAISRLKSLIEKISMTPAN